MQRQRREVDGAGRAARVEHLAEVAGETEAADVGAGVHADESHGRGRRRVEHGGLLDRRHHVRFADDAVLERAGEHADAEALGEHELVAHLGAAVVDDLVGPGDAGDGQAVLGLLVVDGVPAGELGAGLQAPSPCRPGGSRRGAPCRGRTARRRGSSPSAAGAPIAYTSLRALAAASRPNQYGRVDDGREEVDRLHEAEVVADRHHRGVVTRLQETRELTGGGGHAIEDGLQVARTQLGRSTALGRELCESDLLGHATSLPQADARPDSRASGRARPRQSGGFARRRAA